MEFVETHIAGVRLVRQTPFADERGYFARAYCREEFKQAGIDDDFVQINMSGNAARGTIRGLHYQSEAAPEAKFLRCVRGIIYDVIVDMRPSSETYGQWFGVELSAANRLAIFVPPLCAHGYVSMTDDTEVLYQTSAPYTPSAERGVRFDDPRINIKWPVKIIEATPKDRSWPDVTFPGETTS